MAEKPEAPFARFRSLARKLVAVPKKELDVERVKKAKGSGPTPKSA